MIIHSVTGWQAPSGSTERKKEDGRTRRRKEQARRQRTSGRTKRDIEERQLRRLHHRIAHLAALMRLNMIRGTGRAVKFPPDGNLEGKNGQRRVPADSRRRDG